MHARVALLALLVGACRAVPPGDPIAGDGAPELPGIDGAPLSPPAGLDAATVDRFSFVVFGDVRPRDEDDDEGYPEDTIAGLLTQAGQTTAQFAIGTGDYMFASDDAHVNRQLDRLLSAERGFTRPIYHAMGNHECLGKTTSNCPNGTESANVIAYLSRLVPFAEHPYFSFALATSQGEAKFVFVAPNAWDDTQQRWLEDQLGRPTAYTFVVRHEPPNEVRAPSFAKLNAVLARFPITLSIYGHFHRYERVSTNEVISGNGGAPLKDGAFYGFLEVDQLPDGNVAVHEIAPDADQPVDTWAVTPAGLAAP